jgi:hypothetical protein
MEDATLWANRHEEASSIKHPLQDRKHRIARSLQPESVPQ